MPCLTLCLGLQHLRLCGGGSLSPACKFDASGAFSGGKCTICVQRCTPWFVRLNNYAFNSHHTCVSSHVDRPKAYSPASSRGSSHKQGNFKTSRQGLTAHCTEVVPLPGAMPHVQVSSNGKIGKG